jgi:PPOX class probable F420-dependent enzyme
MSPRLPDKIKEWLDGKTVVSLATIHPSGQPQVSPVWATHDNEDILLSTLESRQKFKNLAKNPRATVLIFPMSDPYIYAELRGTVSITRDGGRELIDRLSMIYTGDHYPVEPANETRVVIRLKVERISGRVTSPGDYVRPPEED